MSRRLVRSVVVPLLLALVGFVLPLAVVVVQEARHGLVELAERRAASVALLAGSLRPDDIARIQAALPRLTDTSGGQTVVLSGGDEPIAETGSALPRYDDEVVRAARRGNVNGSFDGAAGVVTGAAPVEPVGSGAVAVVTLPAAAIRGRVSVVLGTLAVASAALLIVAVVAGRSLARSFVRPVERIDAVAARLAEGDLSARATVPDGPPELRRLARTLNATAAQLQDRIARESAFAATASHELRTPLTALRLRLETLQATGAAGPRVDAALAETDRLGAVVEQLLALSHAQRRDVPRELVDVGAAVRDVSQAWTPLAQAAGVHLTVTMPDPAPRAQAVPGAVHRVLHNYLSNAVRAAPGGSTVEITADNDAEQVRVTVRDQGPGLDEQALSHAFDRFWRAPAAGRAGGSGLGLAIVAELAAASGGSATLRPAPGGGLVAELVLPRAEST